MNVFYGRNIVRSVMVTPTTDAAGAYETELNNLDSAFFLVPDVPVVWVWKTEQLDFERLRMGLQRTLNRIPTAAGRIRAGKNRMMVSNVGSAGCLLELQKDKRMPDEDAHSSAWCKYGVLEPIIPREPIDVPLVTATLTHFDEGGSSLYVRFSHVLMDGASMVAFMQMWSWETGLAHYSAETLKHTLPAQSPPQPECSHALPAKDIPLSTVDLEQRLTLFRTLRFFAMVCYNRVMDEVADFEFTLESWDELKRSVQQNLPKGSWVSSYEAFMGLVLQSMAKAEKRETYEARAVVNIRGRSPLFCKEYFGVGLSVHKMEGLPVDDNASTTAHAIHKSLREALKDTTEMEKLVKLPEAFGAIDTGLMGRLLDGRERAIDRARFLAVWENCIAENKCVINSWVGYPWLEMNFGMEGGKASRPNYMRVPPEFRFRRHIHIAPVSETRFQLRMQLPAALMADFRRELAASGFPFREISKQHGIVQYNNVLQQQQQHVPLAFKDRLALAKEVTRIQKGRTPAATTGTKKTSKKQPLSARL